MDNVLHAVERLDGWLEEHDWKAYDPFDGLSARLPGNLIRNNRYLGIALQQLVKRSPVNLRPLLGIRPATSSKGMGFLSIVWWRISSVARLNGRFSNINTMTSC